MCEAFRKKIENTCHRRDLKRHFCDCTLTKNQTHPIQILHLPLHFDAKILKETYNFLTGSAGNYSSCRFQSAVSTVRERSHKFHPRGSHLRKRRLENKRSIKAELQSPKEHMGKEHHTLVRRIKRRAVFPHQLPTCLVLISFIFSGDEPHTSCEARRQKCYSLGLLLSFRDRAAELMDSH